MKTDYPGIDYGMGMTNFDRKTGIHYGVINANNLGCWCWEELESIYAHGCPECGADFNDEENWTEDHGRITCCQCDATFADGDQWGDEIIGYTYDRDGYQISGGSDGDLFVIRSPWVANLQFCSPCAPGAGHMENPCDDGPLCYVLGEEWFDEYQPCPYTPRPV